MMDVVMAGNFLADAANSWISGAAAWLWAWIQCLSYWIAALGGTVSMILFMATHDQKFKTALIVMVLTYILIKAAGSVI